MEDYKEEYELGSIVTAKRTYNGEIITGEFGGFHLLNKSNPKSIVGVVHTPNGSYDVEPNSIESVISEDERIRKALTDFLDDIWHLGKDANFDKYGKADCADWIAWLKKQGEQNNKHLYDVIIALWDLLDKIDTFSDLQIDDTNLDNPFKKIEYIAQERHKFVKSDGYGLYIQGEQITDFKQSKQKPADKCIGCNNFKGCITCIDGDQYAHITEQKPTDKIETKKELKKIEQTYFQKQEWTGYDEKAYEIALLDIDKSPSITKNNTIDWLKSLKDRYTWKPSDEQIKGIECAIKTLRHQLNVGDKRLDSLYADLKKLKG